ncbi:hypothetical protein NX784_02570 [Massilia pinisoli]|uniref:Uncharacterized protein n=1 Tax=Massilia pinisoli TaxID=1772194 RepID=A0ABT1ZKL1_9BURK|nr:hypothetical protein [Massilia pinisoli]MCS0580464.1 hypothetical protein [Massilia pinisoli]
MNGIIDVKFAVYGALQDNNTNSMQAIDVTRQLQQQIDAHGGIVAINNTTMGSDPAYGVQKQFGAIVSVNGQDTPFACQEGQTVVFYGPERPLAAELLARGQNTPH